MSSRTGPRRIVDASPLASARVAAGLTQRDLARRAGVTAQAVCHWELGRSRPSTSRLPAIAHALGVSVGRLVGIISSCRRAAR